MTERMRGKAMNVTRRGFVTIGAALVLAACSSGGESAATTAAESEWHTILFEGLSMEVPTSVEIDEDKTAKYNRSRNYWATDQDITINVNVSDYTLELTGEYDVREVNGLKLFVSLDSGGDMYDFTLNHNEKSYSVLMFLNKKTGDMSKYEEARDHIIESLSF